MIRGTRLSGYRHSGYTIVEVMIFMAITGVLFVSAMILINDQNRKTEFNQAIRDAESRIQDVINDTATGYYTNNAGFRCQEGGGAPVISRVVETAQGTNEDCIFLGRALQFGVHGSNGEGLNVYNIVGLRQRGDQEVTNLTQAQPTAIAPSGTARDVPDTTESLTLQHGLRVTSMQATFDGQERNVGAVAFLSSLAAYSGGDVVSGSQSVNVAPVRGTRLDMPAVEAVDRINAMDNNQPINPDGGVKICFESSGTDQHGVITIGGSGRQLTTNLTIGNGGCP